MKSVALFLVLASLLPCRAADLELPDAFTPGQTVELPAGTYPISKLRLPHDVTLAGAANGGTILVVDPASTQTNAPVIVLGPHDTLRNLTVHGNHAARIGVFARNADGVAIENVSVDDLTQAAIEFDHVTHFRIENCTLSRADRGIHLIFSSHGKVSGNTITDCTQHGIQFWGNWEWQEQQIEDLIIENNRVDRSYLGAIWGTGGRNVHLRGNQVDGALDVGLDLEWCRDSTIEDNVVHRVGNAAVALFFSCDHVQITGNTLYNDAPAATYTDGHPTHRYGIWLTSPDKSQCPVDDGHRDILILHNHLFQGPQAGAPVQIGRGARGVAQEENQISPLP